MELGTLAEDDELPVEATGEWYFDELFVEVGLLDEEVALVLFEAAADFTCEPVVLGLFAAAAAFTADEVVLGLFAAEGAFTTDPVLLRLFAEAAANIKVMGIFAAAGSFRADEVVLIDEFMLEFIEPSRTNISLIRCSNRSICLKNYTVKKLYWFK